MPQQNPRTGGGAKQTPIELWKNQQFCCEHCRRPGAVHFRVTTDRQTGWIMVCESCWPHFQSEAGYRYGGTRKANRRKRRRA